MYSRGNTKITELLLLYVNYYLLMVYMNVSIFVSIKSIITFGSGFIYLLVQFNHADNQNNIQKSP